jgi:TfoX/Sxy family transcriptional regulator of competence genes
MAPTLGTMAYDEELADRIRELINELVNEQTNEQGPVDEKKMFGGLGFLLAGNLAVCASHDGGLLVRTDGVGVADLLLDEHVDPMTMGGRESKTWLRVAPDGLRTKRQLRAWVARGVAVARALPAKA